MRQWNENGGCFTAALYVSPLVLALVLCWIAGGLEGIQLMGVIALGIVGSLGILLFIGKVLGGMN